MVAATIRNVFTQENQETARRHWRHVADRPLDQDQLDQSTRRLIGEIKRRIDVVGILPNEAAIVRLVGALMLERNDEWAVGRRYMNLEILAPVGHTDHIRLPAVAA